MNKRAKIVNYLNDEGKQTHLGHKYTPQDLERELNKKQFAWKDMFVAEIRDDAGGACVLRCKHGGCIVSPGNPSQSVSQHKLTCAKYKEFVEGAARVRRSPRKQQPQLGLLAATAASGAASASDEEGAHAKSSSKSSAITKHFLSSAQIQQFVHYFAIWVYVTETPFKRMNNKWLKKACKAVGITLPEETAFRTTLLEQIFAEVEADVKKQVDWLLVSLLLRGMRIAMQLHLQHFATVCNIL
jgi:hypothetical protein